MARPPTPPLLEWQPFVQRLPDGSFREGHRSAVPGGWVVLIPEELGSGVFFYADPAHRWNGDATSPEPKSRPAPRARTSSRRTPLVAWEPFLHALPDASPREGFRAPVPGGWFVLLAFKPGGGVFFFRDPPHAWGAEMIRALDARASIAGSTMFARAALLLQWKPFRHAVGDRVPQEGYRARVPGGWFVLLPLDPGGGAFFYEDPTEAW